MKKKKFYLRPDTKTVEAEPLVLLAGSQLSESEEETTGVFESEGDDPIIGLSRLMIWF